MQKSAQETRNVSAVPPGRWVWNDESQTVEFVSPLPTEKPVLRKRRQTSINFNELLLRAEWLAEMCALNHRGRQSTRKSLNPAHLNAYRSMVMQRQRDHVTIDDVKQVAVSLLQENYSLPIPFCFLTILQSKVLDEVLSALLLYLSCFFEHKSLENKPNPLMVLDTAKVNQMIAQSLARKDLAQKKLAVCYFTLIMDLEMGHNQHTPYHKGRISSDNAEWHLHACLYSFFCYVAWVAFGRRHLKDIQEELGRLLYSDTFNTAVRNRSDGYSRMTSTVLNGSVKTTGADPKGTGCNITFKQRSSKRHPALSGIVNQCSPLMVSLLPSPREQSPHLFLSGRVKSENLLQTKRCESKTPVEELNQQLASISIGIVGKPLKQFSPATLIPYGEQRNNRDKDWDKAPENDGQQQM